MGASQPTISVLVPYRPDGGQRDRVWLFCRALWEQTDLEVVVDDQPDAEFSLPRSVNRCAARAHGDVFATMGADFLPNTDAIEEAIALLDEVRWVQPFRHCCYLTESATEEILTTGELGNPEIATLTDGAAGLVVVSRETWEDVGGYDERFVGWGPEDHAFINTLATLHGDGIQLGRHHAIHLWHPPAERVQANFDLYEHDYAPAVGDVERMRALISGRR